MNEATVLDEAGGIFPTYDSFCDALRPVLKVFDSKGPDAITATMAAVPDQLQRIRSLISRAVRTGAILDGFQERRDFQKELDYLAKLLERLGDEPEDPLLEPFRADALAAFPLPAYAFDDVREHQERSPDPGREELRQYLLDRASKAGIRFEDGLVEDLAGQLTGDPEAWPLLDFCLRHFYAQAQRGSGNKLRRPSSAASFDARLFAVAIVAQAYAEYPAERKTEFRQALVQLSLDRRSSPRQGNLKARAGLKLGERYRNVQAYLLEHYLLWRTDPSVAGAGYVLVHRCILDRLSELDEWAEREQDKQRARRNWFVGIGAVVALSAGAYVWYVTERAAEAQANEVAIASLEWLPVNNDFALAMALEAVCMKPTDLGWGGLARALDSREEQNRFVPGGGDQTLAVGYLPVGPVVLALSAEGATTLWEMVGRTKKPHALKGLGPGFRLAAFSAEGGRIAVAREQAEGVWSMGLWQADTGERIGPELGLDGPVSALEISRDGTRVAVGYKQGYVTVLLDQGSLVAQRRLDHGRPVSALAFDRDGRRLVVGGNYLGDDPTRETPPAHGKLTAWDLSTGERTADADGELDQSVLAVGYRERDNQVVSVWAKFEPGVQLRQGREITKLADVSPPAHAAFDATGQQLLVVGVDGSVQIVDIERGKLRSTLSPAGTADGRYGMFNPEGTQVAVSYADKTARVLSVIAEPLRIESHRLLPAGADGVFTSAAFRPVKDKKEVAAGTSDGRIYVLDGDSGTVHRPLPSDPKEEQDLILKRNFVNDVDYSPDGRLIVAAYELRGARVWDAGTGKLVATALSPGQDGNRNAIRCASFDPDPKRRRYVTTSKDGTVTVWKIDGDSSPIVKARTGQSAKPFCTWFLQDGQSLVAVSADGVLLAGPSDSTSPLAPIRPGQRGLGLEPGGSVVFDGPSGKIAVRPAPDQGDYVSVLDVRTGEASGGLPLPGPRRLTNFALQGKRLGLLEADGVSVWNTEGESDAAWIPWAASLWGEGRAPASDRLRKLTKGGRSGSVARLSPDGFWLFVAGSTGDIRLCRACGSTADEKARESFRQEALAFWDDLAQDRAFAALFPCMRKQSRGEPKDTGR